MSLRELQASNHTVDAILANLNPVQREAVEAPECNMMVVAGAGSGKTRVLIHRFAYLVHRYGIAPHEILAVTFTNKAANEMRSRAEQLLNMHFRNLWIGTFHGTALRILRIHHDAVGLPEGFEVIDPSDQLRIIKRLMKEFRFDGKEEDAKEHLNFINYRKEQGQRARHAVVAGEYPAANPVSIDLYEKYEKYCFEEGLVDFAEMLLRTLELWQDNKEVRESYQKRFRHILVDEFQDSNQIQEAWLRTLKGSGNYLMVVGDDDQAIYGWRGARVENLLGFGSRFDDVQRFTLEQNYRSTDVILNAANDLIKQNDSRLGKRLWSDRKQGELVREYLAPTEEVEARYVVAQLQSWLQQNPSHSFNSVAVLYRNNALSRMVEQVLTAASIPYRITGGVRFFARAEIRDALAYMKLMHDVHSNVSFERIVNEPKRGIGNRTVDVLKELSNRKGLSLWSAAEEFVAQVDQSKRGREAINEFLNLINAMREKCQGSSLAKIAKVCIEDSGLLAHYLNGKGETSRNKAENLEELVSDCSRFNPDDVIRTSTAEQDQNEPSSALQRYLDKTLLDQGEMQEAADEAVNLMTLHSSKGLEFPLVFIVGMEEQILPISEDTVAEERRLVFVGMTRAMDELHLCSSSSRMLFGRTSTRLKSRFLSEIPEKYVKLAYERPYRYQSSVPHRISKREHSASMARMSAVVEGSRFQLGQDVVHDILGSGTVIGERANGQQVQIMFEDGDAKWLVADTPKLQLKQ